MFQIITVLIFLIYLGLVYKFRKDNIVLLLLTLIAILTLCNVKNVVEGQNSSPAPVNNNSKVNSNNPKVNSNNKNSNNNKNSTNKNSNNGPRSDDRLRFVVSADYQMGPYDGLVLTTGNDKSKYLKLNNVSLASKKDMCVYQGIDLPLDCKQTMFSGMGPSVTGVEDGDQNMFMLYRNKSSPNCCPSTFSTSTGSVCTTQDQRDYIARRGMVAPKVVAPKPKSTNSNQ